MKQKTKRILTTVICILLALCMVLPVFFTALGAVESSQPEEPTEYTVVISNSVTSTSRPLRVTVEMGKTFTLPVCGIKNDDNDFGGWFCANNGTFYSEDEVFENEDKLEQVVFYATWLPSPIIDSTGTLIDPTPESVTVSFEAGLALAEGSLTVPAIKLKPEDTLVLPKSNFTVTGYEFNGWQVGGVTLQPDMFITQINADMAICAKWKRVSSTASSAASSATSSATSSETSSADVTSSPVTSSEETSSLPVSSETASQETSSVESAPAVSSQPEKKQYSVRLKPGHEDVKGEEVVLGPFDEGTNFVFSVELHSAFSRSGYTFTGWKVGDETYVDGNYITVNSDITATAKWKKKTTSSQTTATSSEDNTPEGYTDPTTGISLDGGLTFGTTMRVKKYTDKSVTDVYTAMLLKSKYLIVGYNIYVSSDISFTGGNLTIPVDVPEEDQDGAVVLYHVVGSKEVRLPKYSLDEFENKIVFDSSSGQPAVSWVDFTSDFPSEFALKVGEDRYAEIYIYRGDVEKLELEVSFLSPFLICRADAKYEAPAVSSESTVSVDIPVAPEEPKSPFSAPVIIALGVAVLCVAAIVLMRVLPKKQDDDEEDGDFLSSGR
ncbi:MAG: InlB B-repeat-containing protein [Clostridia bacterium]|nr:InlB B-repeat-containing protein [Clostridia bacterium]